MYRVATTYRSLTSKEVVELDNQIKDLTKFQLLSAKAIVCDYFQLDKYLKKRNPFWNARHYVQAIMLKDEGDSDVDRVTLRLVTSLYENHVDT